MRARLALAVVCAALSGCTLTLKPDYTDLLGLQLPPGLLAPDYVPVNAAVFEDLAEVNRICAAAITKTGGTARGYYPACAISQKDGRCLIVKWTNTTWAHLGHEAGHCLFTARAQAGQLAGIPPHFLPNKATP